MGGDVVGGGQLAELTEPLAHARRNTPLLLYVATVQLTAVCVLSCKRPCHTSVLHQGRKEATVNVVYNKQP